MSNYEFWIELSNIYKAINAYQQKAIEFNKRFIFPWIRLGNIFEKQSRSDDAIKAYQKAIELDPQNAHVWNEIGNVHLKAGDLAQASEAYQKAMECDPASGWPYNNLALAYFRQEKYADAVPLFLRSIGLFADDKSKAASWNRLGDTYQRLGDNENAVLAYRKADQLDPDGSMRSELGEANDEPGNMDVITVDETTELELPSVSSLPADQPSPERRNEVSTETGAAVQEISVSPKLQDDPFVAKALETQGVMEEPVAAAEATVDTGNVTEPLESQAMSTAVEEAPVAVEPVVESVAPVESQAVEEPVSTIEKPLVEEAVLSQQENELSEKTTVEEGANIVETASEAAVSPEAVNDQTVPAAAEEPIAAKAIEPAVESVAVEEAQTAPAAVAEPTAPEAVESVTENVSVEEVRAAPAAAEEPIVVEAVESAVESIAVEETQTAPPAVDEPTAVEAVKSSAENVHNEEVLAAPAAVEEPIPAEAVESTVESVVAFEVQTDSLAVDATAVLDNGPVPEAVEAKGVEEEQAAPVEESIVTAPVEQLAEAVVTIEVKEKEPATLEQPVATATEVTAEEAIPAAPENKEPEEQKVTPLTIVNALVDADAKSAHVWNELGNIYISIGAYEQAIDVYHKAIELDPEFGWPYSNLALTYFSQGKCAEAIPLYQKSIELLGGNKEKAMSWNRLGNAYRSLNNIEKAAKAYKTASDLDPENKTFKENIAELPSVPETAPVEVVSETVEPVHVDTVEAPAVVQVAPVASVASAGTMETDVQAAGSAGVSDAAAVEPAAPEPTVSAVETVAAPVTAESTQDAPAAEVIVAAADISPDVKADSPTQDSQPSEEVDESAAAEEKIVIVEENTEQPTSDVTPEQPQPVPDDCATVSVQSENHTSVDTKSAHIWNDLGRTYYNKGNFDDAVYAYKKAIEFDPEFGRPYSNLAAIYLRQGLYAEAIPLYQRSVELLESDNEKAASWNKLGNAYRRLGDYDKAIAAYHMADELDPLNTRLPAQAPFNVMRNSYAQHGTPAVG